MNNIALLYKKQSQYGKAGSLYLRALAIWEQTLGPNAPDLAIGLSNLGGLFRDQGRFMEAESLFQSALGILKSVVGQDNINVAFTLNNLASIYWNQGKYDKAEPLYKQSIEGLKKTLGTEHPEIANTLVNLAILYHDQGKYSDAEIMLRRAIEIVEITLGPDNLDMANALTNLASVLWIQGRYVEAKPFYERTLAIAQKMLRSDHPFVAKTLNNLATLCDDLNQFYTADSLYKGALAIQEKSLGEKHVDIANTLSNWATHYRDQRKYAEASVLFQRSIAINETAFGENHPTVAAGLNSLARSLFVENGEKFKTAVLINERAIRIWNATTGYPNLRGDAYSLRAQMRKQKGDLHGAVSDLGEALRTANELRPQIGGGEEKRAGFWGRYTDNFNLMVAWQVEAGAIEKTVEYAERGRARVLLDRLTANKIDLRSGISDNIRAPLEKRETDAKARIAEYQQRTTLLRSRKDITVEEINRQIAELEGKLRTAYNDYQQVYEEIKNASPLWKALITSGGEPVSLDTIQRRLVAPQSLMLIYQIGKEGSFLFVIPPAGQKPEVVQLKVIDQVASILGVQSGSLKSADLQKIWAKHDTTKSTIGLIQHLIDTRGVRPLQEARLRTTPQLHALWQVLVPENLWPRLVKCSEVILIPDGVLNLLPFEALVVKVGKQEQDTRYWLDEGPVIRYAPSATTLYNIEQAKRASSSITKVAVLSLSDPIYDPAEVASMLKNPPFAKPSEMDSSKDRGESLLAELDQSHASDSYERVGGVLNRLPGTAREAKALRNVFRGEMLELSQLNANESKLRAGLPGKRYIHLATHGIIDPQQNSSLAALALTSPPGETTNAEDDGFLQLYEIFDLKLPECELAVLSACQTNIGRNFEGEGVFALSRGFLAAGARRAVASQWSVDDVSTAELIGEFFRQIAGAEKKGQPINYALALRDSKRKIRNQKPWAAPFFWAPFVLTGKR